MDNKGKWDELGGGLALADVGKSVSAIRAEIEELDVIASDLKNNNKIFEAVEVYKKLVSKAVEIGDSELAIKYKDWHGFCLLKLMRYTEALAELIDIEVNYKVGDNNYAFCWALISQIYISMKIPIKYNNIEQLILKSIDVFKSVNYSTSAIYSRQSEIEWERGNYRQAIDLSKEALSLRDEDSPHWNIEGEYYLLASSFYKLRDEQNCQKYLKKFQKSETMLVVSKKYKTLLLKSMIAELQSDFKSAWKFAIEAYEVQLQSYKCNGESLCRVVEVGIVNRKFENLRPYLVELLAFRHTEDNILKYDIFSLVGDYYSALFAQTPLKIGFLKKNKHPKRKAYYNRANSYYRWALELGIFIDDRLECDVRRKEIEERIEKLNSSEI